MSRSLLCFKEIEGNKISIVAFIYQKLKVVTGNNTLLGFYEAWPSLHVSSPSFTLFMMEKTSLFSRVKFMFPVCMQFSQSSRRVRVASRLLSSLLIQPIRMLSSILYMFVLSDRCLDGIKFIFTFNLTSSLSWQGKGWDYRMSSWFNLVMEPVKKSEELPVWSHHTKGRPNW